MLYLYQETTPQQYMYTGVSSPYRPTVPYPAMEGRKIVRFAPSISCATSTLPTDVEDRMHTTEIDIPSWCVVESSLVCPDAICFLLFVCSGCTGYSTLQYS